MTEKIGDAKVEVVLDGDGPKSKAAKKDIERDAKRQGQSAGEAYASGLDEGSAKGQKKAAANIRRRFEQMRWSDIGDGNGAAYGQALTSRITKSLRENAAIEKRLQNESERTLLASLKRVDAEQQRLLADRSRRAKAAARAELTEWQAMFNSLDREAKNNAKEQVRIQKETQRDLIESYQRIAAEHRAVMGGQRRGGLSYKATITEVRRELDGLANRLRDLPDFDLGKSGTSTEVTTTLREMDRGLGRVVPRLHLFNRRMDSTGTMVGRVFGRGSRSDIVNLFGAIAEGGFRTVALLPRIAESAVGFGKSFVNGISEGKTVLQALSGAAAGGGKGLTSFGAALASAAVAIPIVVVVVGTLVSVMSLLLGVVTALAASLTFALAGALGAVVGAFVPVVAGIGVLTAAILSLSDAQKAALKTAIKPFVEGMKEIGRAAAETIFGGEQFKNTIAQMTSALTSSNMKGLVVGIAQAIGDVGNMWAASLNSPGFQSWVKAMSETLPDQIRDLGAVFRNTVGGFGGILLAMQPFISSFTGWLERITGEFSEWANSERGREQIVRFFDRAKESAKAVGEFLGQITGLLADLFDAGKETGDSIFQDMADAVQRFRDYIADGGLEQWFKDAKTFAEDLGSALSSVASFIDQLDNAVSRFTASGAFKLIGWLDDLGNLIGRVTPDLSDFITLFDGILNLDFGKVKNGLLGMLPNPADFGISLSGILSSITGFVGSVASTLGAGLSGAGSSVWSFLTTGLSGAITGALGILGGLGSMLLGVLGTVLSPVGEFFRSFFTSLFSTLGIDIGALWTGITTGATAAWTWVSTKASEAWSLVQSGASTAGSWVGDRFSEIQTAAGTAWSWVSTKASEAWSGVQAGASTAGSWIGSRLSDIRTAAGNAWDNVRSGASTAFSAAGSAASTMGSVAGSALGNVLNFVLNPMKAAINAIKSAFDSAKSAAKSLADTIGKIKIPSFGGLVSKLNPFAAAGGLALGSGTLATAARMASGGGIVRTPQKYRGVTVAEAGSPELIVPTRRPLHMVDPLVRPLSAIAQGMTGLPTNSKPEKKIDASGWTIVTSSDARTAAAEIVNRMAGVGM